MGRYSLFQMCEPRRQSLIACHLFYMEQARKRLLDQFSDLEKPDRADAFIKNWVTKNAHRFDPNFYDEGDAYEEACERYQALTGLGSQMRLNMTAGIYHEWDKHLRKWLTDEIRHWHFGELVPQKVWKADFGQLTELLEGIGWKVRSQEYFPKLDACRLVVNVQKHGLGNSFNDLKKEYPKYLPRPFGNMSITFPEFDYWDHTDLVVSDDQLQSFSDAIVAFWKDVPKDIFNHENLELPGWFEKTMSEDRQQKGLNI